MASAHQPMETADDPEQFLITAGLYERMCIAAAKLAVAAGASPADARRASGLQRVEIRCAMGPVRRQTVELAKVAVLAGDEIPRRFVTSDLVLSERSATMAGDYLRLSTYARDQKALCLYRHAINDLNQEFNKISSQFFTLREQFRHMSNEYDVQGDKLTEAIASAFGRSQSTQSMGEHAKKFSWPKRLRFAEQLHSIVSERDRLRVHLSTLTAQLADAMDNYQRHQARRAYLRSLSFREYSDYKSLFVPRSTFYSMKRFDFGGALVKNPEQIAKVLRLSSQMNQIRAAFSDEQKNMKLRHQHDTANDHSLYRLVQAS